MPPYINPRDKAARLAATEIIGSQAVLIVHVSDQLYRVAHQGGLTEKEHAFLENRRKELDKQMRLLAKLEQRLRHGRV